MKILSRPTVKLPVVYLFAMLLAGVGLLGSATGSSALAAETDQKAYITGLVAQAQPLLSADISDSERQQAFQKLVEENFDFITLARFALGRMVREADPNDIRAYAEKLKTYSMLVNSKRISDLPGSSIVIGEARPVGRSDMLVSSTFTPPEGAARGRKGVLVDWRVRGEDGNFLISDIVIEGVSMAQTLRDEVRSVVGREGLPALIEKLDQKIKSLMQ